MDFSGNCNACMQQLTSPFGACRPTPADPLYPAQKFTQPKARLAPKKSCTEKLPTKKKSCEKNSPAACEQPKASQKRAKQRADEPGGDCGCEECSKKEKDPCEKPAKYKRSNQSSMDQNSKCGCDACSCKPPNERRVTHAENLNEGGDTRRPSKKLVAKDSLLMKKTCDDSSEDGIPSDSDVWLLQCPKDFDPKEILNCELGKAGKKGMGCSTNKFSGKKTLAVIAPEKATEYELVCENVKLLKPIGKIVVSGGNQSKCQMETQSCDSEEIESDCEEHDVDEHNESCCSAEEVKPKNVKNNDSCCSAEEVKSNDKCHNEEKSCNRSSKAKFLPFFPPEPFPMSNSKQRKSTKVGKDNSFC